MRQAGCRRGRSARCHWLQGSPAPCDRSDRAPRPACAHRTVRAQSGLQQNRAIPAWQSRRSDRCSARQPWPRGPCAARLQRQGTGCARSRFRPESPAVHSFRRAAPSPPRPPALQRRGFAAGPRPSGNRLRPWRCGQAPWSVRCRPALRSDVWPAPPVGGREGWPGPHRTSRDRTGRSPSRCGWPCRNSHGSTIPAQALAGRRFPAPRQSRASSRRGSSSARSGRAASGNCRAGRRAMRSLPPCRRSASSGWRSRRRSAGHSGSRLHRDNAPRRGRRAPWRRAG